MLIGTDAFGSILYVYQEMELSGAMKRERTYWCAVYSIEEQTACNVNEKLGALWTIQIKQTASLCSEKEQSAECTAENEAQKKKSLMPCDHLQRDNGRVYKNTHRGIGDLKLEAIVSESCKEEKAWKLRLNSTQR